MTTAGFDAVTTRTLFAFGGEHLEAVYKTTEFLFLSHLFLAISDLFRNGIAALCAATRSHENTNSNPDTDPSGKGQDVTQGMVLAANFSSQ
ncbi:MAG TPA: hypothetical protein VFA40_23965 [Terriglobales bacterium]|nr:hypothetical protein [Terriglobales bacterium]